MLRYEGAAVGAERVQAKRVGKDGGLFRGLKTGEAELGTPEKARSTAAQLVSAIETR
jgi:hypothetical protein